MDNILVGTTGWQHKCWQGAFYPDDLPEDWQLDYYSNLFHCILIQQSEWEKWGEEQIEEIAENLEGEAFYFSFQVKNHQGGGDSQLQLIKSIMGPLFHSVIVEDGVEEERVKFCKQLEIEISFKSKQAFMMQNDTNGWQFAANGFFFSGFPLIEYDISNENLAAQRELLQRLEQSLPEKTSGAIIYLVRPDKHLQQLKEFQILSELLGF